MPGPEGYRPRAARTAEGIGRNDLKVSSLGGQELQRDSAHRAKKDVKRSGCGGGAGYTC